ncbi:hypothetical protein R1sor_017520 [Riccia sorocarpa]|uniref:Reverse transcriptase n=1 Tax=Riccia sorocarpa TaxID=122646 RepID=A0ABD3I734_9MARC
MAIGLDKKGLNRIDGLLRNFLWGWTAEKKPKTALIAWNKLHFPKERGGLGWCPLEVKTKSFLVPKILRLVKGEDVGWMRAATAILTIAANLRPGMSSWKVPEILLLGTFTRVKGAPILSRLTSTWQDIRKHLNWVGELISLVPSLQVDRVEAFLAMINEELAPTLKKAQKWWRKLGWTQASDFIRHENLMYTAETQLRNLGIFLEEPDRVTLQNALLEFGKVTQSGEEIQNIQGWRWADIEYSGSPWEADRSVIQKCLYSDWMRKNDHLQTERLHERKMKIQQMLPRPGINTGADTSSFLALLMEAIHSARVNVAYIVFLSFWIPTVWHERNKRVFEGKRIDTPVRVVLRRSIQELTATKPQSEEAETTRTMAITTLETWRQAEERVIRRDGDTLATQQLREDTEAGTPADFLEVPGQRADTSDRHYV